MSVRSDLMHTSHKRAASAPRSSGSRQEEREIEQQHKGQTGREKGRSVNMPSAPHPSAHPSDSNRAAGRALLAAGLLILAASVGVLAVAVASAGAASTHVFTGHSFGPGGTGLGTFSGVQGIAVDESTGDVYVYDSAAGGSIYKFDAEGEPAPFASLTATAHPNVIEGVGSTPAPYDEDELAVDNSVGPAKGDIYIADTAQVAVYSAEGTLLGGVNPSTATPETGGETCGVALDSSGNVYVGHYEDGGHVDKYTPTDTNPADDTFDTQLENVGGICEVVADSQESVYAITWTGAAGPIAKYEKLQFGSMRPLATPFPEAGPTTGTALAIEASTNDVYVDSGSEVRQYALSGALVDTFGGISASFAVAVNGSSGGVTSGDVYVSNGGRVEILIPPGRPDVEEESLSNVSGTSATFEARVNPVDADTSYHFEYGTKAGAYEASAPVPDVEIGSGVVGVNVASLHVQGLASGTVYHYRVVATNSFGITDGTDQTFTTQSVGAPFVLPDGRQYELVSPADKHGTEVMRVGGWSGGGVAQASEDGSKMTYLTIQPSLATPTGDPGDDQVLSTRGENGWETREISPQRTVTTGITVGGGTEYRVFSSDLSAGILESGEKGPEGVEEFAPGAPTEVPTTYMRDNLDGSLQTLLTASDLPPTTHVTATFVGASSNLSHVVFSGELVVDGVLQGGLFEWADGQLHHVSVLPGGKAAEEFAGLGSPGSSEIRGAVSNDGSNTIWTNPATPDAIYDRDIITETTTLVASDGEFQMATSNASKVFYNSFTSKVGNGENVANGLAEYDVGTGQTTQIGEGEGTARVLGTSENGSYVYYEDSRGIVLYHEGQRTLVSKSAGQHALELLDYTSNVSPSGQYLAFMSDTSPTGYDNIDVNSGVPDAEVYLYDANTGHLICGSCNPTGARPAGEEDGNGNLAFDPSGAWNGHWVSGMLPTWEKYDVAHVSYQPRALFDSGRLFFGSAEALVPRDTNGKEDVYEYEMVGVGSCTVSDESFSEKADGCISLISSGTDSQDTTFLDAGDEGNDVFIRSRAQLVPQDVDHVYDVYDAHVCSTSAPCYPVPPVTPPTCSSGDGCRPAPSPQPAAFGAPASATFSGAGNVVGAVGASVAKKQTLKKTVKCAKGKKFSHGKCIKAKRKRVRAKKSSDNRRASR
jgi:hypothetical protein